jgi:hypothetical protein
MAIPPSHNDNEPVWSERDLLVLYNELSLGSSIQDIATRLNRTVEEVREKVASLKVPGSGEIVVPRNYRAPS